MPAPLHPISLAVVGVQYPNADKSNRAFEILLCAPGEPVDLLPEPRNRKDPRAVAVLSSRQIQIGYVSAERCGRIGALIREGRELRAVFQAKAEFGAWIRVAFDGDDPVLPPQRERDQIDQDFWPDEEWPDD